MNPKLKFENLEEKKLIGKRTTMSFSDNKTPALWKSFMARRKEIQNAGGPDLFSVEIYPPFFFDNFDPTAQFEKWAAVEVTDFATVPKEMETLVLPSGLYAVFIHKGLVVQRRDGMGHAYRAFSHDDSCVGPGRQPGTEESVPPSPGTFPVNSALFTVLLIGVVLIIGALASPGAEPGADSGTPALAI